jgi:hypothetical protein
LDRVGLLGRTLSPALARRVTVFLPGSSLVFEPAVWSDSLVEVERGSIELQLRGGGRRECRAGDVLTFAGLPIVALGNSEPDAAVLVAVSRRRTRRLDQESGTDQTPAS